MGPLPCHEHFDPDKGNLAIDKSFPKGLSACWLWQLWQMTMQVTFYAYIAVRCNAITERLHCHSFPAHNSTERHADFSQWIASRNSRMSSCRQADTDCTIGRERRPARLLVGSEDRWDIALSFSFVQLTQLPQPTQVFRNSTALFSRSVAAKFCLGGRIQVS